MTQKFLNNRFFILYLFPFFLGFLTVFSFQPFNLTIINFLILPIFFYLTVFITKKSKSVYRKKPFKINLLFGLSFGFGLPKRYFWITNSLTFDENFKILIPFGLILIPLFLGLFVALPVTIIGPKLKFDFASLLIFSFCFALSDYLEENYLLVPMELMGLQHIIDE